MPLPPLRSPRWYLQPFAAADLDALHALWTDPEVRRYLWDDLVISRERAAETLEAALATADRHGIGHWTLREEADGAVVGEAGCQLMPEATEVELMCALRKPYWGRGLAAEAARCVLAYLWQATAFTQVFARTDPPNHRSLRLMERLGMRHHSTDGLATYVLDRLGGSAKTGAAQSV